MLIIIGDTLKKLAIIYIITSFLVLNIMNIFSYGDDSVDSEPINNSVFMEDKSNNIIESPRIPSGSAIVMDRITGRILYEKNAYIKRPIASTTKIMTAILALEKGKLSDIVTVSSRAAMVGGSNINLMKNERLSLNDLLYGLMLNSGNDAAIAIAEHIGGSVENFAVMMTDKAHEIGAIDSWFKTPHGLDKEGHYSTAYDLAVMANYALKNKKFAQIVSTKEAVIANGRRLTNTNEMLTGYPGADGVKTGYTGKAGRCLVTSVTRNNWQLISVILRSDSRHMRASDSSKILNYAFENYKFTNLNNFLVPEIKIKVNKGKVPFILLKRDGENNYILRKDEINMLKVNYKFPEKIEAPLKKDIIIGSIKYTCYGDTLKCIDVRLKQDIEKKSVIDFYNDVIGFWLDEAQKAFNDSITKL